MSTPVAIPSLLAIAIAIAIVRRLLLDLKIPEEEGLVHLLGQPAETWVTRPIEELGGQTPAQVLSQRPAATTSCARGWKNE